ncbi:NAD(P)/FAD-dependent oxidoreductase [Leeia oryzae]|uniref:NAD(P)/FAD-dependent oxidoreductase n=1 Tax=Leeia oryzae TaxID=356662 RepID=UPI0003727900|nr:FAD-dependent oxidoreductase [Leeia oryzae]
MSKKQDIIVVGAGVVGICCAASLRRDGHHVTLVDKGLPAKSTSFGNAGAFAVTEILPLSEPGILKKVPGWLLDPLGPLAIKWRYLPGLMPWLLRFLAAGRPAKVQQITQGMHALLARAETDLLTLVQTPALLSQWHKHGALTLYDSQKALDADNAKWQRKRQHGWACETLTPEALHACAPMLNGQITHAVHTPAWSFVDDPYLFSKGIAEQAFREGVSWIQSEVSGFLQKEGRVVGVRLASGSVMHADQVVVATGVWSGELAKSLGYNVPLESERGYHVTLPNAGVRLDKFLISAAGGFVILPMGNGAIRIAGTVELASKHAPETWARAKVLIGKARQLIGDFNTEGAEFWMGNRPALPDTLPVISAAPRHPNVTFAFGHGHLGLTLGATTGQLVANLMAGNPAGFDYAPYAINRF